MNITTHMSMYIDGQTLARIGAFISITKIARKSEINENTLWSHIKRDTLDTKPVYMQKIGSTLADHGIFVRRENETPLEFASRVNEYCRELHRRQAA